MKRARRSEPVTFRFVRRHAYLLLIATPVGTWTTVSL
jgi:hypothetical protein